MGDTGDKGWPAQQMGLQQSSGLGGCGVPGPGLGQLWAHRGCTG